MLCHIRRQPAPLPLLHLSLLLLVKKKDYLAPFVVSEHSISRICDIIKYLYYLVG
jgi:hypothetical protein